MVGPPNVRLTLHPPHIPFPSSRLRLFSSSPLASSPSPIFFPVDSLLKCHPCHPRHRGRSRRGFCAHVSLPRPNLKVKILLRPNYSFKERRWVREPKRLCCEDDQRGEWVEEKKKPIYFGSPVWVLTSVFFQKKQLVILYGSQTGTAEKYAIESVSPRKQSPSSVLLPWYATRRNTTSKTSIKSPKEVLQSSSSLPTEKVNQQTTPFNSYRTSPTRVSSYPTAPINLRDGSMSCLAWETRRTNIMTPS